VQVPDVLTRESAERLRALLHETPWELAWQAGAHSTPQAISNQLLAGANARAAADQAAQATDEAGRRGDYSCRFASYPILKAYLERRNPGGAHDALMEGMNMPDILDLVRQISGIAELVKADAQATMFAGNHFLGLHDDSNKGQGWRVAYVLNLAPDDWNPNWGGYLQFFDDRGDIVCGWRPRFNVLNLMAVPCPHAVKLCPPVRAGGPGRDNGVVPRRLGWHSSSMSLSRRRRRG